MLISYTTLADRSYNRKLKVIDYSQQIMYGIVGPCIPTDWKWTNERCTKKPPGDPQIGRKLVAGCWSQAYVAESSLRRKGFPDNRRLLTHASDNSETGGRRATTSLRQRLNAKRSRNSPEGRREPSASDGINPRRLNSKSSGRWIILHPRHRRDNRRPAESSPTVF